jgi:hypothetical protein
MRLRLEPTTNFDELVKMKESFKCFALLVTDKKESSRLDDIDEDAMQETFYDIYVSYLIFYLRLILSFAIANILFKK